MKSMRVCAVMVMSAAIAVGLRAGESRSPEQLGAHWARVSDEVEIQLIVDGLRSIGGGTGGVMGKHVSPNVLQLLVKKNGGTGGAMRSSAVAVEGRVRVQGTAATVDFSSGEKLQLEKIGGRWMVTGGRLPDTFGASTLNATHSTSINTESGVSVGETFIDQAISREHGIERLTRSAVQSKIERRLFGMPGKTASYYSVKYSKSSPFVSATYVQFVLDQEWDRIVYGNMDKWIKSYNVQAPSAIAVDADGNVFLGEPAHSRVLVLKLVGSGENATLQHRHQINDIVNPADLAINDNGTPFDTNDDFLYVADPTRNVVLKYTAGSGRNTLNATFEGFDSPTSLAVGRWNGANENLLYVVDKLAKRVRVYEDVANSISLLREIKGTYCQYFASIKTDHFGNVYLVDNVNSHIMKYTASLDPLDQHGGDDTFAALGAIDIPFAKIVVEGERSYWTGLDQLFAVERWDNASGAQRRKLGIKLKNIDFRADADISAVTSTFVLTDVGDVSVRIYDEHKRLVRTLASSWMVAGQKALQWDRRNAEGKQVPAGTYRYELGASSAYGGEPTISNTRFYLPMYHHEDCGSTNRVDDAHLVQGSVVAWGSLPSQTANEHASSVQYRFTGLNPAGEYEVAAEYGASDGAQRLQDLTAGGIRLHEPVRVSAMPTVTAYIKLPKDCYANGELLLSVNKLAEGSAIVSQLWFKETGVGFNPQPVATIPAKYLLEQNYPNPFNPTTTIRYGIPNDGIVTLKVYNINGQEVATLVNEAKQAGKYEVTFDAKNILGSSLASGVYFYRVKAGNYSETKKMVLLK